MPDTIRNLIPAIAVACTLAAATRAEPARPAGDGELETVTVYARRVLAMTRVAASVTVIPRESIERGLVSDVKELVRYEPGLSVRSDPFRFGLDTFAIRGVGGNRVAVEIDGIPAAGGFAIGSFSDSGRSFVDTAFLDRVEVLRGPASSLYGSDAIGGVVAMSTLTPRSLLGADGQRGLRAEAGASGVDDGWHAVAIGATRAGAVEALLGYAHRAGSEAETAADVVPNPRDYASDSLLARLDIDGAAGGPLALTVEGGRLSAGDLHRRVPRTRRLALRQHDAARGRRLGRSPPRQPRAAAGRHEGVRFGRLAALRAGYGYAPAHARGAHSRAAAHAAGADRAQVPPRGPHLRRRVHRDQ